MAAYKGNDLTKIKRVPSNWRKQRGWPSRFTARNNPISVPVAASVQTTEDFSV